MRAGRSASPHKHPYPSSRATSMCPTHLPPVTSCCRRRSPRSGSLCVVGCWRCSPSQTSQTLNERAAPTRSCNGRWLTPMWWCTTRVPISSASWSGRSSHSHPEAWDEHHSGCTRRCSSGPFPCTCGTTSPTSHTQTSRASRGTTSASPSTSAWPTCCPPSSTTFRRKRYTEDRRICVGCGTGSLMRACPSTFCGASRAKGHPSTCSSLKTLC
mmetsp:Transcript_50575/g.126812  ORF Transcript_50575/g.126812 Transcript_50575/m.126812 type:complete len:213 (-) Transcript_50575:525-1163(-)